MKLGKNEEHACVVWQRRIGALEVLSYIASILHLLSSKNGIEAGGGNPRDLDLVSVVGLSS